MRQLHADVFDVALQRVILIDAHVPAHFRIHLLAGADLLLLAHEGDLMLSGDRIGGARRGGKRCGDERNARETSSFHMRGVLIYGRTRPWYTAIVQPSYHRNMKELLRALLL